MDAKENHFKPPILTADLWNHAIFPLLDPLQLIKLARVSKWFFQKILRNYLFWQKWVEKMQTRNYTHCTALPPNSPHWPRFAVNYYLSEYAPRDEYGFIPNQRYCAIECDKYLKPSVKAKESSRKPEPAKPPVKVPPDVLIYHGENTPLKSNETPTSVFSTSVLFANLTGPLQLPAKALDALRAEHPQFNPLVVNEFQLVPPPLIVVTVDKMSIELYSAKRIFYPQSGSHFIPRLCPSAADSFLIYCHASDSNLRRRLSTLVSSIRMTEPLRGLRAPHRPIIVILDRFTAPTTGPRNDDQDIASYVRSLSADGYAEISSDDYKAVPVAFNCLMRLVVRYTIAEKKWIDSKGISPRVGYKVDLESFYKHSDFLNPFLTGTLDGSLLHYCIPNDKKGKLTMKILEDSPAHVIHWRDSQGENFLHVLARHGAVIDDEKGRRRRRNLIRLVLSRGADPLCMNHHSQSCLFLARGTEYERLFMAHLEGKIRWESKKDDWDWIAEGPLHGIAGSANRTYRNGFA